VAAGGCVERRASPAGEPERAGAEVAVGLGLVLQLERRFRNLDIDAASELAG